MIGLDRIGNPVETILEKAKKIGKATGLVSDTRISHSTPAAFASHQRHRSLENEIALEMLSSNNVDVMLSGGLQHWLPVAVNDDKALLHSFGKRVNEPSLPLISVRDDEQDLLALAEKQGVTSIDEVNDIAPLLFTHRVYKSYPLSLIEKKKLSLFTALDDIFYTMRSRGGLWKTIICRHPRVVILCTRLVMTSSDVTILFEYAE